jgi:hypothetical protein
MPTPPPFLKKSLKFTVKFVKLEKIFEIYRECYVKRPARAPSFPSLDPPLTIERDYTGRALPVTKQLVPPTDDTLSRGVTRPGLRHAESLTI